jgi:hypothetical protein
MKTRFTRILTLVLVLACVAWAVKVTTDYDHRADFSRYRTYSWLKVEAGNSLWADRIQGAIDAQLAAKGLTRVASGGDLTVAAIGSTREQQTLRTFYDGFPGWYWTGWDGMATSTVDITKVGTLVADMFDSNTKKLVWRGVAEDTLSSKPDKNDKKLEHAVEEMFDHFPPKSKG